MKLSSQILMLSGSHRGGKTTSNAIIDYLADKLLQADLEIVRERVSRQVPDAEMINRLIGQANQSDLFIVSFPLYIDTLPYPLIHVFETLFERRKELETGKTRMMTIVNFGLPEAHHGRNALSVCQRFAGKAGFMWDGGLSIPGAAEIDGAPLESLGSRTKNLRHSLDRLAEAIRLGQRVPKIAVQLAAKQAPSPWLFTIIGNYVMKKLARESGTDVYQRPYAN
jgi:hypothetical protein